MDSSVAVPDEVGRVEIPCCPPLVAAPLSDEDAERTARALRVLADPARLRLLSLVAAEPGGEACTCDLVATVGLSQPTVSHHLKKLVDAGFLAREQRGVWAFYSLRRGAFDAVASLLRAPGDS